MLIAAVVLFILYLSLFPRKIIVFPDHLRIKFLAYRSRIIKADDLLELTTRRVRQVWFRKDAFQCVPLAFGLVGPGIYIRPTKGRAYFFRTRNTEELINVLGGWRGSSVSSALVKKKPIARDPFEAAEHTADWIASIAPDTLPKIEESSASIAPHPLPEIEEPSASIALDPLPEIEEPSASIALDPLPEIEEPSASITPDPLPEIEEPSASITPDPLPEIEEPSASIAPDSLPEIEEPSASIAPDPLPEDRGAIGFHRPGPAPGRSRSHRFRSLRSPPTRPTRTKTRDGTGPLRGPNS